MQFLSTPSARRATLRGDQADRGLAISIHALREEGDGDTLNNEEAKGYFYPRPPRGGRRCRARGSRDPTLNFYPRPPRGGRPVAAGKAHPYHLFLSTPSARRATRAGRRGRQWGKNFYPRPPRGGRLVLHGIFCGICKISIHALREEGDEQQISLMGQYFDFYPRPPRGGRPQERDIYASRFQFLSTPSARRATNSKFFRVVCPE